VQKTRLSTRTGAIVRAEINGQKDDKRIKRQHREKTLGIAYNYLYICGFVDEFARFTVWLNKFVY
jgi:hypothetical protein